LLCSVQQLCSPVGLMLQNNSAMQHLAVAAVHLILYPMETVVVLQTYCNWDSVENYKAALESRCEFLERPYYNTSFLKVENIKCHIDYVIIYVGTTYKTGQA